MSLLRSRRAVLLLMLATLLLLDLARSAYARVGYAQPLQTWQPDPAVYADLAWPPGADLPASAPAGQRLYIQHCAVCHGPDGRGNGPAAPSLIPRPRDFSLGQFKYTSSPPGQPPSDADLSRVISGGLQASAMPGVGDLLSEDDIRALVGVIKSFSPAFSSPAPQPLAIPPRVTPDAGSLGRGAQLFTTQGCAACHGADGRARLTLPDAKGYPVIARDLTAPWTFRGGSRPEDVWLRLTTGLAPSPMPSFADRTTPEERWDLVNYVLSLARTPPWEPGGQLDGPGQAADSTKRGEYLVHAEMCGLCHTIISPGGIYRADDFYLAGGMRVGAYPQGTFISRNLTGDPDTGLGRWSDTQVVEALRNGRAPDRVLNPYAMPWALFHTLTDDDARGIATYLRQLRPVRNQIPSALHAGVIETLMAKTSRGLPSAGTTVLTYADGDFGQPGSGVPRDLIQDLLVGAQRLVLAAGVAAFIFVAPSGRRLPRRVRGWIGLAAALVGLALVGFVGAQVYATPALSLIPPEVIASGNTATIPRVDARAFPRPEQAALAQRGQYLFTVASCALCHGNRGEGGLKLSWFGSGTLWTRNISSDPQFGIGAWSDAEIARAIRSGVSRDGRALHWQGMPWDHFSNWDEEDIRALVAYVRMLPPVPNPVPPPRPPAPDDCQVYTFWTSSSMAYGCQ